MRWRQLVDLVARAGANATSPGVAQALDMIRTEAPNVDEALRASAARAVSALPLPLSLLEYFASDRLSVSAPVLAAATLDSAQWRAILQGAGSETRRFVETLHPEIRDNRNELERAREPFVEEPIRKSFEDLTRALLEAKESAPLDHATNGDGSLRSGDKVIEKVHQDLEDLSEVAEREPQIPEAQEPAPTAPSLRELIERIERRRRSRASFLGGSDFLPSTEAPIALFRWECGANGEIDWVDEGPRGTLIGRSLARQQAGEDYLDPSVARAFTRRSPFRDETLILAEGRLAGTWKISGNPVFGIADGRFAGYSGFAARQHCDPSESGQALELLSDPGALRELVHEIKTPLNAIIGFGELIAGQYLGPAERRYRDRAQEIVRQGRLLLAAIEELDFAAEIQSSKDDGDGTVDLNCLIQELMSSLRELGAIRGVEIKSPTGEGEARGAISRELAERLMFRMCAAVIDEAQAGERLQLDVEQELGSWKVSISRPDALSGPLEDKLFATKADFERAFPLRLVRGLARIGGADLTAPPDRISLVIPRG